MLTKNDLALIGSVMAILMSLFNGYVNFRQQSDHNSFERLVEKDHGKFREDIAIRLEKKDEWDVFFEQERKKLWTWTAFLEEERKRLWEMQNANSLAYAALYDDRLTEHMMKEIRKEKQEISDDEQSSLVVYHHPGDAYGFQPGRP